MVYLVFGLIIVASIGVALYAFMDKNERLTQISALRQELEELQASDSAEIEALRAELTKFDKLSHIPNIIDKSKKLEGEIAARLKQAQREADAIALMAQRDVENAKAWIAAEVDGASKTAHEFVQSATKEAERLRQRIVAETQSDAVRARSPRDRGTAGEEHHRGVPAQSQGNHF